MSSTIGNVNWTRINTTSHDSLLNICFVNSKVGYSVGSEGTIVKTANAGVNRVIHKSHTNQQPNSIFI